MKQAGAILIQTLIFLTVLAILSITMIELTQSELITSRTHQQQYDSFTEAQNAALEAERWLSTLSIEPQPSAQCLAPPCIHSLLGLRNFHDFDQWKLLAINRGNAEQPRYFLVELLSRHYDLKKSITTDFYQITAISWLTQDKTLSIIQRVVSKRFDEHGKALNQEVQRHSWRLVR